VHGGARALLAALAAMANSDRVVEGLSTEEIREAAGISDRTYRRACGELIAAEALTLEQAGGGRAHRNLWRVTDPCGTRAVPRYFPRARTAPALGTRQLPLIAAVRSPSALPEQEHGGAERPASTVGRGDGNSGTNNGQNRTPSRLETPAITPAQTPAPYVRAGRESQNHRITPPDPPEGGHDSVRIVEDFISPRGRRRTRDVRVDLSELAPVSAADKEAWHSLRECLRERLGANAFEIWLAQHELIAVSAQDRALLLAGPIDTHRWVSSRYRHLVRGAFRSVRPIGPLGQRPRARAAPRDQPAPADGRAVRPLFAHRPRPAGGNMSTTYPTLTVDKDRQQDSGTDGRKDGRKDEAGGLAERQRSAFVIVLANHLCRIRHRCFCAESLVMPGRRG
jgi:hypothetical protein